MGLPQATIIIPSYNEGKRLPPFLFELVKASSEYPGVRILVVDDGSLPIHLKHTQDGVMRAKEQFPEVDIEFFPLKTNRGKGGALEAGFLKTTTPIVGFVDADGSVPASECFTLLKTLITLKADQGVSAVLATRVRLLGKKIGRKPTRHIVGRAFATLVSYLFGIPIYDSQCGCKFFLRDEVVPLLPLIQSKRWQWDTQLVLLLYLSGRRLREIPISWEEVEGSKVSLLRDPVKMFIELFRFRKYIKGINLLSYRQSSKSIAETIKSEPSDTKQNGE